MSFFKNKVDKDSQYHYDIDGFEIAPLYTGSVHKNITYIVDPSKNSDTFSSGYTQEIHPEEWATSTVKRLNNYQYRCDDFTDKHVGKHILFMGCSVTWGDGLNEEELWSKKVYNTLSSMFTCSGYFNVSFPGTGIMEISYKFEEYVRKFGKPDYLIINLPQLYRFFGVTASQKADGGLEFALCNTSDDRTTYAGSNVRINPYQMNMPAKMVAKYMIIKQLHMLETFCKYAGIKLYLFTWDTTGEDNLQDELKDYEISSLIEIDKEKLEQMVYEEESKSKDEFGWVARDNAHFGTYYHSVWAKILIDKIIKDI